MYESDDPAIIPTWESGCLQPGRIDCLKVKPCLSLVSLSLFQISLLRCLLSKDLFSGGNRGNPDKSDAELICTPTYISISFFSSSFLSSLISSLG